MFRLGLTFLSVLGALTMAACGTGADLRYFHAVDGEVTLSGQAEGTYALSALLPDYGAGTYSGDSGRLLLHLDLADGQLSASVGEPAVGVNEFEQLVILLNDEATTTYYECGSYCQPCQVTLTAISDESISGNFDCSNLGTCTGGTPAPGEMAEPLCGGAGGNFIDASAAFTLTQPTDEPLEY